MTFEDIIKPEWNFNMPNLGVEMKAKVIITENPLHYDRNKIWWKWQTNKWKIIDETDVITFIKHFYDAIGLSSSAKRTEIMNALKDEARFVEPKPAGERWVQFGDTIYDFYTNEKLQATPEYFVTNPIPWTMADDDLTPTIDKLFSEWVGPEYKELLYEIIAYCMLPDYPLQRLFALIGSGRNGKSTFLKILKKFIGEDNCCSSDLEMLSDYSARFSSSKLFKKLVCIMGETNFNNMKNTKMIKELTGNDLIAGEFKNKNPFDFVNYAKIIISSNCLPTTSDKTDGFYRRWVVIPFINKFAEKADILRDIPDKEFNHLARKSYQKLQEILRRREFTNEGRVRDRRQKYEEHSNPVLNFLKERYVQDVNGTLIASEAYANFVKFCGEGGFRIQTYQEFISSLNFNGIENQRKNIYQDKKGKYYQEIEQVPEILKGQIERKKLKVIYGFQPIESAESTGTGISNHPPYMGNQVEKRDSPDSPVPMANKYQTVIQFIESKGGGLFPLETIYSTFPDIIKPIISEMLKKGILSEPRSGYIKVMKKDNSTEA